MLIKDNHFVALGADKMEVIETTIRRLRDTIPAGMKIQAEADSMALLKKVLPSHPDMILLDNMRGELLKKAVLLIREEIARTGKKIEIEASGGITLKNVRDIALSGVDRISIGAITHSSHNIDFSLDIL